VEGVGEGEWEMFNAIKLNKIMWSVVFFSPPRRARRTAKGFFLMVFNSCAARFHRPKQ